MQGVTIEVVEIGDLIDSCDEDCGGPFEPVNAHNMTAFKYILFHSIVRVSIGCDITANNFQRTN